MPENEQSCLAKKLVGSCNCNPTPCVFWKVYSSCKVTEALVKMVGFDDFRGVHVDFLSYFFHVTSNQVPKPCFEICWYDLRALHCGSGSLGTSTLMARCLGSTGNLSSRRSSKQRVDAQNSPIWCFRVEIPMNSSWPMGNLCRVGVCYLERFLIGLVDSRPANGKSNATGHYLQCARRSIGEV